MIYVATFKAALKGGRSLKEKSSPETDKSKFSGSSISCEVEMFSMDGVSFGVLS